VPKKTMGNLEQHAGAVASFFFGTVRAAMIKVDKILKSTFNKLVTGAAL